MNQLYKANKSHKGKLYLYFFVVILMVLFYNHVRIFEFYDFNIFNKYYTFNFVPFKNMFSIIQSNGYKLMGKIIYLSALYFLVFKVFIKNRKSLSVSRGVICMIVPWISAEILYILTSTNYIHLDINQGIVFFISFGLGYLAYKRISFKLKYV